MARPALRLLSALLPLLPPLLRRAGATREDADEDLSELARPSAAQAFGHGHLIKGDLLKEYLGEGAMDFEGDDHSKLNGPLPKDQVKDKYGQQLQKQPTFMNEHTWQAGTNPSSSKNYATGMSKATTELSTLKQIKDMYAQPMGPLQRSQTLVLPPWQVGTKPDSKKHVQGVSEALGVPNSFQKRNTIVHPMWQQVPQKKKTQTPAVDERVYADGIKSCPEDEPPKYFGCFQLGGRMVCGMARPTPRSNTECKQKGAKDDTKQPLAIRQIMKRVKESAVAFRKELNLPLREYVLYSLDGEDLDLIKEAAQEQRIGHAGDGFVVEDFSTPDEKLLLQFTQSVLQGENKDKHVLVHCAGGMGRTGMFLIALVLQTFWEDGHAFFKEKASASRMVPYAIVEHRKPYTSWYQPIEEAIRFVQFFYNAKAAELDEVQNYATLAGFAKLLPNPRGLGKSYTVLPDLTRVKERGQHYADKTYVAFEHAVENRLAEDKKAAKGGDD